MPSYKVLKNKQIYATQMPTDRQFSLFCILPLLTTSPANNENYTECFLV